MFWNLPKGTILAFAFRAYDAFWRFISFDAMIGALSSPPWPYVILPSIDEERFRYSPTAVVNGDLTALIPYLNI